MTPKPSRPGLRTAARFIALPLWAGVILFAQNLSAPSIGLFAPSTRLLASSDPLDGVEALIAKGRYAEADARAKAAAATARQQKDQVLAARAELTRGAIWLARGFAGPAVTHFTEAMTLAQRTPNRRLVADTYAALASAHADLGHWDRVLDFAERQREADDRHTPAADFRYFFQRGVAFEEVHDREQAKKALETALTAARTQHDDRDISMALGELAQTTLEFDHDSAGALKTFDEALAIAQRAGLHDLEATWLVDSGAALRESNEYVKGKQKIEQALALERQAGARRVTPAALKNLAQILLKEGNPSGAEAALARAERDADEQNLTELRWQVRVEEAAIVEKESPDRAEQLFAQALDILEDTQGSVLVEQLRTGTWTHALNAVDPYDLMIDLLLDNTARNDRDGRDRAADAFFIAERGRARAFLETLGSASDAIAQALPPDYVEAEAALLADISEGQAALRAGLGGGAPSDRRALEVAIRSDEEQLNTLRLRLAADRPSISAIRYPRLWHARDLKERLLQPHQALVMYFLGGKRSTMWVIERRGISTFKLPPRTEIEEAALHYLEVVKRADSPEEPAQATKLWQLLFPESASGNAAGPEKLPKFSIDPTIDQLIVVPDGVLNDLPFEALRDPQGKRLIERVAVSYAPSASTFALLANRGTQPRAGATFLGIGNPQLDRAPREVSTATRQQVDLSHLNLLQPLRFASIELHDIATLYGPAATVLEGADASEPALRGRDLSNVAMLHFATHGMIDEDHPERSGLILTAVPPADDGVLQTREVYALKLREALVTLSACDTALGANVRGEGIIGLSRAFFYAGAGAVTASLWSVDDRSTAALMTAFYQALIGGFPASEALRRAKLQFLHQSGDWSRPYYWAAFVVSGNGSWRAARPAYRSSGPAFLTSALVALCGAIIFTWLRYRSRRDQRGRTSWTRS